MKIDEPDTPFAYLDNEDLEEEEGDSMSAETGKSEGVLRGGEDVTDARVSPPPDARPGDLSSQWAALEGKLEHAALEAEAGELVVGAEKHSTEHKKKVFKVIFHKYSLSRLIAPSIKSLSVRVCINRTSVQRITTNSRGSKKCAKKWREAS